MRLIFFTELDGAGRAVEGDMAAKLKSFSESTNRKFQSLGSWTNDHQLMLNSFLQERFLMANLVKNANVEIEKSRTQNSKTIEGLRRYESENEAYKGLLSKLRGSLEGHMGIEVDSIISNIFLEAERISSGHSEIMREIGDLRVTDGRIQSLIREKDAELSRMRD